MKIFDKLTAKNFNLFASHHYDDPQCSSIEEFEEDLRRFRYLKRLLYRYHEYGEIRERLMVNHIICIFNVFGFDPAVRMLKFKIKEPNYWSSIKTILLYLNYIDEGWEVETPIDDKLVNLLRDL